MAEAEAEAEQNRLAKAMQCKAGTEPEEEETPVPSSRLESARRIRDRHSETELDDCNLLRSQMSFALDP